MQRATADEVRKFGAEEGVAHAVAHALLNRSKMRARDRSRSHDMGLCAFDPTWVPEITRVPRPTSSHVRISPRISRDQVLSHPFGGSSGRSPHAIISPRSQAPPKVAYLPLAARRLGCYLRPPSSTSPVGVSRQREIPRWGCGLVGDDVYQVSGMTNLSHFTVAVETA